MKSSDLFEFLNNTFPEVHSEAWDNTGIQIVDFSQNIENVLITLDITDKSIEFAKHTKADLIIAHHPFIFSPLKNIDLSSYKGRIIKEAIINQIGIYSLHTNYDVSNIGMNKQICDTLQLINTHVLNTKEDVQNEGYGMIGELRHPVSLDNFIDSVKKHFNLSWAMLYSKEHEKNEKTIHKIAYCGGSGADFITDAANQKVDLYLTGDIGHHDAQLAYEAGIAVLDVTHYGLEKVFITHLANIIKEEFPELSIFLYDVNHFSGTIK